MAKIKQLKDGLIFNCDCGAEYKIMKDENGKLVLEGTIKPPEPPEPKPKPKGFFDSLFESGE